MVKACSVLALCLLSPAFPDWAPLPFVSRPINPAGEERFREAQLPVDIDKDGKLDFFSGEGRDKPSWWFQRGADGWKRWLVSDSNIADVGAVAMDVDGDGWTDKVSSGLWYRNPGFPPGAPAADTGFRVCRYSSLEYLHDIVAADFDGDGRADILTIDYGGIHWFRTPPPDSACGMWEERMVVAYPVPLQDHGGIAAGDLDGDGDPDVARMDRWYENADGKGSAWIEHANIPFGPLPTGFYWGLSGRALIADVDGDGHNDLAESECDLANGRVFWFSNPDGKGLRWVAHLVKDSTDGQDFHSLILADFDGDGDPDLFSAGAGSSEKDPKAYVWENLDGKGGQWKERIIQDEGLEIHDAAGADMDGDGDTDILALDWALGSQFYLENQTVPNPASLARGRARGPKAGSAGRLLQGWRKAFTRDGRDISADGRIFPAPR
jgi:hypothetical protein